MASDTEMENALKLLFREASSKEVRTAIETLLKIFRNIAQHPEKEKYRHLKLSNSTFFKTVWRYTGARQFLLKSGWKSVKETSEVCFEDQSKLDAALKILLSKRNVSPENDEWTGEVVQGLSKQQLREIELREKAIMERDKELSDCLRGKEERRKIAEYVKAEHKADRRRLELLKPNIPISEARVKELSASTESTEVLNASTESTEVLNASTESTEVSNASTESTEVSSASTESTKVLSVSTESTEVLSASTESTEVLSASAESTGVLSVSTESTEVSSASAESTEVSSASADSTEVSSTSTESTKVLSASAESTEVLSASAESTEVLSASAESTEVLSASAESMEENKVCVVLQT